jgi:hypothetical protein
MGGPKIFLTPKAIDDLVLDHQKLMTVWKDWEMVKQLAMRRRPIRSNGDTNLIGIVQHDVGCIGDEDLDENGENDCDAEAGTGLTVDGVTVGCGDVVIKLATLADDGTAAAKAGAVEQIALTPFKSGGASANLCEYERYLEAGDIVALRYFDGVLVVDEAFSKSTEDCG